MIFPDRNVPYYIREPWGPFIPLNHNLGVALLERLEALFKFSADLDGKGVADCPQGGSVV